MASFESGCLPKTIGSLVYVLGISKSGESVRERDVNIGTGQGPSDEVNAVIISWIPSADAEARYEKRYNTQEL